MTRFPYTANFDERGVCVLEIECELEVSAAIIDNELEMSIGAVLVNGVNLLRSNYSTFKAIGLDIIDMAERDQQFIANVMDAEGIASRSKGYGDPDGHFERAA